jgi:thiol-disulfide isomerase/thioredoxin
MNNFNMAALLAVSTAFLLAQAVAFSPGSSPLQADAPTRLSYRNYDDINIMIDASTAEAASSPPVTASYQPTIPKQDSKSVTPPKLYDDATFTVLDVDADRMPLSILLEPPAAPLTKQEEHKQQQEHSPLDKSPTRQSSRVTSTASRAATRSSPITQLFSIQDYNKHVLNSSPNQLCIIRFHAPWCQVCRTTNVSWERMVSKIVKMNSSNRNVKFLSVNIDGKNEEVLELKDMLKIEGVPQGVIHHASDGVFGQKVNLNRKNLGVLKKQLESYLTNDMGADMFLYGLKKEM